MTNLIAYIPVLNQQHINWLQKHPGSRLLLISNAVAENLLPRLSRNMGAVATDIIAKTILAENLAVHVEILEPHYLDLHLRPKQYIMPDEDVSHLFMERYLHLTRVKFEEVWGRWDMTAVKRQEPVIPDMETSSDVVCMQKMADTKKLAQKSPDWWRQVAASAFHGEKLIATACNAHYPNEYEVTIFGDPRINFDAGDPTGSEVYLSLHAEKGIIAACARMGVALEGASVYVTTFPCGDCARMLAECRIKELFFSKGYSVLKGFDTLKAAGVRIVKINDPESA
jgi:dCMP deaminase